MLSQGCNIHLIFFQKRTTDKIIYSKKVVYIQKFEKKMDVNIFQWQELELSYERRYGKTCSGGDIIEMKSVKAKYYFPKWFLMFLKSCTQTDETKFCLKWNKEMCSEINCPMRSWPLFKRFFRKVRRQVSRPTCVSGVSALNSISIDDEFKIPSMRRCLYVRIHFK